ncbi:MAG: HyaD/HybD family hydrogenase maturation endopeptidase [Anaerolineae bacterium]|nr:HyaD/HybD family hydrogenase maturation endopeptidase [Anaerolineae bacterium]
MGKTLVLGLGNILLRDEGVGVRAVQRLAERFAFSDDVQVLDGGTLGLDLLHYVEEADRVLIVDAVATGNPPGTLVRLSGDEVPAFLGIKISPHQMGLADLLAASRLRGRFPRELVLVGVEPEIVDTGLELSPSVAAQMDALLDRMLAELARWGVQPHARRRDAQAENRLATVGREEGR